MLTCLQICFDLEISPHGHPYRRPRANNLTITRLPQEEESIQLDQDNLLILHREHWAPDVRLYCSRVATSGLLSLSRHCPLLKQPATTLIPTRSRTNIHANRVTVTGKSHHTNDYLRLQYAVISRSLSYRKRPSSSPFSDMHSKPATAQCGQPIPQERIKRIQKNTQSSSKSYPLPESVRQST